MMNVSTQTSMDRRIDSIRASESDRQTAKEGMHDAELVAELLCRAGNTLRFAGEILGRLLAEQGSRTRRV